MMYIGCGQDIPELAHMVKVCRRDTARHLLGKTEEVEGRVAACVFPGAVLAGWKAEGAVEEKMWGSLPQDWHQHLEAVTWKRLLS